MSGDACVGKVTQVSLKHIKNDSSKPSAGKKSTSGQIINSGGR